MRLASFVCNRTSTFGVVNDLGVIDLGRRVGSSYPDLRSLLGQAPESVERWKNADDADHGFEAVSWLPVIPNPGQVLCVGLNYRKHVEEVGRPLGQWPTIFLRVAQSQVGHRQPIMRPKVSEMLDYEGELAVIIGKPGRHIRARDALEHVLGYAPYNDISVRDWQRHSGQYTPGKNFPATGAFGPWLLTSDEVADPAALTLTTRVNGEVVQHAPVSDMIFSVPELIAYISTFTKLHPGDVIVTGTPEGIGSMREPPLWLRPRDTVEVDITHVGTLVNSVVQEPDLPASG